jgi:multidrug efflux pump subunit AcrA (membrane-fusion protein)
MTYHVRTSLVILALSLAACGSRQANTSRAETVPIRVSPPVQLETSAAVPVSGSVVSSEGPANVAFLVSGKVVKVGPREGDLVRRGALLAEIDPTDFALGVEAAVAQTAAARAVLQKAESPVRPEVLEQAKISYERAQDEYERMRRLYQSKSLAPNDFQKYRAAYEAATQQYEQARAGGQMEDRAQARAMYEQTLAAERVARKRLADARLVAPEDGFIAARSVEAGDMGSAGRSVFQIVRLDPVEVSVGVPETDIRLVRTGQSAIVSVPALPGETFKGTVRVINISADPATRTYMVRISVPNPRYTLRLGMIAEARIQTDRPAKVLAVPGEAIVRDSQGASAVFVYFPGQGRVYSRRVNVGAVYGTRVEIESGIAATDPVVVAGQNKLRDGVTVTLSQQPDAAVPGEAR